MGEEEKAKGVFNSAQRRMVTVMQSHEAVYYAFIELTTYHVQPEPYIVLS
jgi:hypothetical protein